jgi:heterodisulfide reductase subunit C
MNFREEIEAISGHKVNVCFQCNKCSSGCPMVDKMDLKPAQVMHSIRLGRKDSVLHSKAIWLCLSCETCSARCPQDVQPAAVINAARVLAIREGVEPAVKEVGIYYRGFINNMRLNGRIHDTSVVALTRLLSGRLFDDLPLAWKLLLRGRIKPPPLPLGGKHFRIVHRSIIKREKEWM